jgi:hypothetical protein
MSHRCASFASQCAHGRGSPDLGSSNTPQKAPPLSGVEPSKGFVKEFDRVRLLLGHNNRPAVAEEIHRGERNILQGPVKMRALNPRYHRKGLCPW